MVAARVAAGAFVAAALLIPPAAIAAPRDAADRARPKAPRTPVALRVTAVGDGRVALAWRARGKLRRGDRFQIYVDDRRSRQTRRTRAVVRGLRNGVAHTFRVSAGRPGSYSRWTRRSVVATPVGPAFSDLDAPSDDLARPVEPAGRPVDTLRPADPTPPADPAPPRDPDPPSEEPEPPGEEPEPPGEEPAGPPAPPSGLHVASLGDGRVVLDWDDGTDLAPDDRYQVYVDDPTLAGEDQWAGRETSQSAYEFTGLVNGRAYVFRVGAGGPGRYGPWSEGVTGEPEGPPAEDPPPVQNALHVAPNGSDTAAGTEASPLRTVDRAAVLAQPGQTVYLRGGVYSGRKADIRASGTAGHPITFRSYPGEHAIFDGQADVQAATNLWFQHDALLDVQGAHLVVQDLEVRNSPWFGLSFKGSSSVVRDVVVHDTWQNGVPVGGQNVTVEDSEVYRAAMSNYNGRANGWAGGLTAHEFQPEVKSTNITFRRNDVHEIWGEAVCVINVIGATIADNTVRNGWSVNIYLDGVADALVERNFSARTGGWNVGRNPRGLAWANEPLWNYHGPQPAENLTIRNNVFSRTGSIVYMIISEEIRANAYFRNVRFVGNTLHDTGFELSRPPHSGSTGNVLKNNIIDGPAWVGEPAAWDISHNAFPRGNRLGASSAVGNPGWVNPNAGTAEGFRLQSTSPLRTLGTPLSLLTADFAGAARPALPAIGAFEG